MSKHLGFISKIVNPGGYFFINCPERPYTRIFGHFSKLNAPLHFLELKEGQNVEFEMEKYFDKDGKEKGWRAFNISQPNDSEGIPEATVEQIK